MQRASLYAPNEKKLPMTTISKRLSSRRQRMLGISQRRNRRQQLAAKRGKRQSLQRYRAFEARVHQEVLGSQ